MLGQKTTLALDPRYAIGKGVLFSTFIHPSEEAVRGIFTGTTKAIIKKLVRYCNSDICISNT